MQKVSLVLEESGEKKRQAIGIVEFLCISGAEVGAIWEIATVILILR